jgi:hypothetical protein
MEETKSTRRKMAEIIFRGVEGAIGCGLIGAMALSSDSPMYPTAEWIMKSMPIIGAMLGMTSKILEEMTTENKLMQEFEPERSMIIVISRKLLRAISRGIKHGIKTFVYGVFLCTVLIFLSTLCTWDIMLRQGPVEIVMRSVGGAMFLSMWFTIGAIISGVIDGFENPEDSSKF